MEYLNDLINAAQAILDSGFDVQSFLSWKEVALLTLLGLLGPLTTIRKPSSKPLRHKILLASSQAKAFLWQPRKKC